MMSSLSFAVFADNSSVVYEGEAEYFVFLPESTDLFQNMKNLMPGDSVSQDILVKNNENKLARIYLRAEPVNEEYYEFLSYMTLTVVQDGSVILSESLANEPGDLAYNVLLGEFKPGEETTLTATLNVDIEMGNEFQMDEGRIIWIFSVIEDDLPTEEPSLVPGVPEQPSGVPVPEETTTNQHLSDDPQTSDNTKLVLFAIIFGLSIVFGIIIVVVLKKNDSDKEIKANVSDVSVTPNNDDDNIEEAEENFDKK